MKTVSEEYTPLSTAYPVNAASGYSPDEPDTCHSAFLTVSSCFYGLYCFSGDIGLSHI